MSKGITTVEGMEIGDLYTDENGTLWEVIIYCDRPTVTMRNKKTGRSTNGAVGCRNLSKFTFVRKPTVVEVEEMLQR